MTEQQFNYHAADIKSPYETRDSTRYEDNVEDPAYLYGPGCCYFIPSFRGKSSIDPKEFTKYLETILDNRFKNPLDIRHQDMYLETVDNKPVNELALKLGNEVMTAAEEWTGLKMSINSHMWTIKHDYLHQTYPHAHLNAEQPGAIRWAVVYWAKVPENSGLLELYPRGLGNSTTYIVPREGDFFIFPDWLHHGVREHMNETEQRISCSFNITGVPPEDDKLPVT
jgi:hypothetical protein